MANFFGEDNTLIRDRLMRAWQNSTELTRDFEMYSKRMPPGEIADMFKDFAQDEAAHASKLRSVLSKAEDNESGF